MDFSALNTYQGHVGLCLFSIVVICLQYFFHAEMQVYKRYKTFPEEYMRRFDPIHKAETGQDKAPKSGYPDNGNGRYSADLSYAEWFSFNNW